MELTRENVLNTLGKIIEPDLKNDLVSLNLIDELDLSENKISLTVQISNPALHARNACKKRLSLT
jgi:ATP-binding protein involved in chromosome partitioning